MTAAESIARKMAEVAAKRTKVEREISKAQQEKERREANAVALQDLADRSVTDEEVRKHRHEAATALQAAQLEGKKIRTLTRRHAELDLDVKRLERELVAARKRDPGA